MANENRRMVNLPSDVAEHVDQVRTRMLRAHLNGQYELPDDVADSCPRWYVVEKALQEIEQTLEEIDAAKAIQEGIDQANRGQGRPAREAIEELARENGHQLT